jgi:hypothetical protein
MRFPMLVLATAISALACDKGAPLSNSTANLEPARGMAVSAAASGAAASGAAASDAGVSSAVVSSTATPSAAMPAQQAGVDIEAGTQPPAPSGPTPAVMRSAVAPAAIAPTAREAIPPSSGAPPSDEGNGEPMDDVDDEEVSVTDRSGAAAVTHEEAADDAPSGPIDDSEGADIEVRE